MLKRQVAAVDRCCDVASPISAVCDDMAAALYPPVNVAELVPAVRSIKTMVRNHSAILPRSIHADIEEHASS